MSLAHTLDIDGFNQQYQNLIQKTAGRFGGLKIKIRLFIGIFLALTVFDNSSTISLSQLQANDHEVSQFPSFAIAAPEVINEVPANMDAPNQAVNATRQFVIKVKDSSDQRLAQATVFNNKVEAFVRQDRRGDE